jgi:hypothetical protein
MRKLLYLLALVPLISFAHPNKCPNVNEIKKMGINKRLFQDAKHDWYGGRSSLNYGTEYLWTFAIIDIKAKTNNEAYSRASWALKLLSYQAGPTKGRSQEEVYCLYNAGKYAAVAISPPLQDIPNMIWIAMNE